MRYGPTQEEYSLTAAPIIAGLIAASQQREGAASIAKRATEISRELGAALGLPTEAERDAERQAERSRT